MASGDVAFQVLANPSLFRLIVVFSSGVPHFIFQIKRQLVCAKKRSYVKGYISPRDVKLWQSAICAGDRRTLEAFRVLSEATVLGVRIRTALHGITDYAFSHTNDLDFVEWVDRTFPVSIYDSLAGSSADTEIDEQGSVEMVQWILNRPYDLSGNVAYGAASKGHVDLVKLCFESLEINFDCKVATSAAASNGHLPVIKCILETPHGECSHGCDRAKVDAAANGHLDVLACLHESQPDAFHADAMAQAATNGHLEVVKYLHENTLGEKGYITDAMDNAATNGHLEIVRFLHENRHEGCSTRAMDGAVCNRHLEVVEFLHANRHEGCSSQAMVKAVRNQQLESLQLLCENRGEMSVEDALRTAAELGYVAYVRYLYGVSPTSSTWSTEIVNDAASSGFLELLKFFHEHDQHFRFTSKAMHRAAIANHLHIVRFLHENRSEGCHVSTLFTCDERGLARIVEYLFTHRPMANPASAIARAKRRDRLLLAAKLERCGSATKKTYVYR